MAIDESEEARELDEKFSALLPPESLYLMLWGQPVDRDRFQVKVLGNTAPLASVGIMASYLEELAQHEDRHAVFGALIASKFGTSLLEDLRKHLVAEMLAAGSVRRGSHDAN